ncbi:pilus assembly FimT family protein [Phycisphaera mikurensis]|uniref:Prepilin-type N-terminal cleavage/methylation domain-containing protein n=1 Tax=Phycisphaera mikurensis (strain NBRC 102666 / KCTC 22515 / FYK2301M01) TaxID=1142394 RepID=I0IFZ6_PHYMF|nr:prepilin-type N-terminal cleavage/methylation domain-containing protein [Phycisphaera mikurensis]MBB6440430.1 prepilin-type N-terminal cleavage/methylation domain-containing protein [Phycisphaera mikurensis]BAM04184.1 hypothetical protein PSMK_20250 [Phycisphaera mikurensis NBRC 102666]
MSRLLPPRRRTGFTLIELLTSIFLISLILGISFPFLRSTVRSSSIDMAVGQVNSGVAAARVYATRTRPFLTARRVGASVRTASANGDGFSGAICLFTPAGALRVLENDENARDNRLPTGDGWLEMQSPPLNGYRAVEGLDEIRLPGRAMCLGIVRTGGGPYEVQLVPPPFAIRFSAGGTLSMGQDLSGFSPFSGDDDFRYVFVSADETVARPTGTGSSALLAPALQYDVDEDRTRLAGGLIDLDDFGRGGTERSDSGRISLPFSVIETVSGVLILDPDQVPESFAHPGTGTATDTDFEIDRVSAYDPDESAAILHWATDSSVGRVLLFNRTTGQDLTR